LGLVLSYASAEIHPVDLEMLFFDLFPSRVFASAASFASRIHVPLETEGHILSRGIGCFPRLSSRASNRVWPTCLSKIICGRGAMLTAIFSHAAAESGLKADWEGKTRFH
jgi:hypothetical protein